MRLYQLSRQIFLLAPCIILGGFVGSPIANALDFTVATNGSDTNVGTADHPFATLERARDAARASGLLGREAVTVTVKGGQYFSTRPLILEAKDSGNENAPVAWRTSPSETVTISGGHPITGWTKVKEPSILDRLNSQARSRVRQIDLKAQGITNFGDLTSRSGPQSPSGPTLELFWNDRPMTLARWPNESYARIETLPEGKDGLSFQTSGVTSHFAQWAKETAPWAHGYWGNNWFDESLPLQKLNPTDSTLKFQGKKPNYGLVVSQRFFVLNLLSELDSPGEWYLDRDSGILYFWPPSSKGTASISLSPTLLETQNAHNISVTGFRFEEARDSGIRIIDSSHVTMTHCAVYNVESTGITIKNGQNCLVEDSDIFDCGKGGINISGGDKATLTSGMNSIQNSRIWNFNRWEFTYHPAIGIEGVGQRASHNLIHDAPHTAITVGGNNHLVEFNEIYNVATETDDVGTIYTGRDWTARGNIIRGNYFHDIQGPVQNGHGAMGVYLDDQASGYTVEDNIFFRVNHAVLIGGGDDNVVSNNLLVDCNFGINLDARGLTWQKKSTDDPNGTLRTRLAAIPYQSEIWKKAYPELTNVLDDEPNSPKRNRVDFNVILGSNGLQVDNKAAIWQRIASNFMNPSPNFATTLPHNPRPLDFRFAPNSSFLQQGVHALPLDQMGLQ